MEDALSVVQKFCRRKEYMMNTYNKNSGVRHVTVYVGADTLGNIGHVHGRKFHFGLFISVIGSSSFCEF